MTENWNRETALTRARYDRIAPVYDAMEWLVEKALFERWRKMLWSKAPGGQVLEVGVGTGKNMPFYPRGAQVTAIDLSDRMLARARQRAQRLELDIDLRHMDVQHLAFPDDCFDAAMATFVFCSVPDPIRGLQELGRVVRPRGDIWLLEHVRVDKPLIGPIMDMLNPLVVSIMGANINRRTVENVKRAGLGIVEIDKIRGDVVQLIHAGPHPPHPMER